MGRRNGRGGGSGNVRSCVRKFRGERARVLLCVRQSLVNFGFVLFQKILEETLVQELGTLGLRQHGPKQKGEFKCKVERDPVQKDVHEHFDDTEKSKNDPVHQPLRVVPL